MTGPRPKRQFAGAASDPAQRQITSFFPKSSSSADFSASSTPSKTTALNGPVLPAQVQTDLLNVGMRVRKAVPEGYKTGNVYSAFQLWAEDNNHSRSSTQSVPATAAAQQNSAFTWVMRELEPFCGLNKVGGLAYQPSHAPANDDEDPDDLASMPGLTSSQESAVSVASSSSIAPAARLNIRTATTTPSRKRFFASAEEEDERDGDGAPHQHGGPFRLLTAHGHGHNGHDAWLDGEVSPRSLAPAGWENARVLAVPRTRQRKSAAAAAELVGQENVMIVQCEDGDDFEEASFLDYRLRGDMEVE